MNCRKINIASSHCLDCGHYIQAKALAPAQVGSLYFDMKQAYVMWQDMPITLTRGESRVINVLVSPPGQWRSYRDLYDVIQKPGFVAGPGDDGWRSNVRSMVKRIRRKFMKVDPSFDQIKNCTGLGYSWKE